METSGLGRTECFTKVLKLRMILNQEALLMYKYMNNIKTWTVKFLMER